MKSKHVVTVAKSGAIYIPKLTTKYLGIFGWAGVVIAVEGRCITMRFYKQSITPKPGEFLVKLQKKSGGRQAMTGGCRKFTEAIKDDFAVSNCLDLEAALVYADEECVRIRIDRPSVMIEESTPDGKEKADAEEEGVAKEALTVKDRQADICREIAKRKTCINISCSGSGGEFAGMECPLDSHGNCGSKSAKDWLARNGYQPYPKESLGTVSKPAEQQLDIFNLPGSKASRTPRTRPLPEGLPGWLRGPLSRGEQVRAVAFKAEGNSSNEGWVSGAFIDTAFGKDRPVAIIRLDCRTEPSFILVEAIKPCLPCLKSAAECLAVAKELGIGLSPMQIEAIINGGVPPESHDLPDEMFE